MGFQDRDYYRVKSRGSAFLSGTAPICRAIIFLNVLVFVLAMFGQGGSFASFLELRSASLFRHFEIWRLFTAPFYHGPGQQWHLVGNMMFLWFVGREMEEFLGARDFAWLYGSACAVTGIVWCLYDMFGGAGNGVLIGSSAPVLAVVMLTTLYYPSKEVSMIFFQLELRWLLTIYLGFMTLQVLTSPGASVSHAVAQLSAAAYGYLFKLGDLRISRIVAGWKKPRRKFRVVSADDSFREPRPNPRPTPPPPPPSPTAFTPSSTWMNSAPVASAPRPAPSFISEEQLDARVDEILAKIATEGKDRLTEDEKRILDEASKRARSRRSGRI